MGFIKGTCIGMSMGIALGIAIGVMKCDYMEDLFTKGKREIRRFKRKYTM